MIGAHIALHLGLCNAMLKMPAESSTMIHVRMTDRINRPHVDQDFSLKRYTDSTAPIEFDAPPGLYQIVISAPQYRCSAADFLYIIDQHNRTITEQLSDGIAHQQQPVLLDGIAPQSFLYLSPTYVLFDKTTQCDKPVPDPIPSLAPHAPMVMALQLQTPTGDNHYIRIKVPFPIPWDGGPEQIQFNVTDNEIDWLSGQPTGVLLCPKLFKTSAG
jgi:hypothetical protein